MKPWIALPTALVLATAGCGASATHASSSKASAAPSPAGRTDALTGTWETAALPTATFVATYRRAGATPGALQAFSAALSQAGHEHRYLIRIADGLWVQLEQHDGGTPSVGWSGTYTLTGDTVSATETETGCHLAYRIALTGSSLGIHLLSDTPESPQCGRTDSWPQRAIYETAAFHRAS